MDSRAVLRSLFDVAVAAADPVRSLPHFLPERPRGRTVVVGAGKASAVMAQVFEAAWPYPLTGVVVTRYGYAVPCERITVLEAAHPVPDEGGLAGSMALFEAVRGLGPDDLVVALVSGGGSALLPSPPPGLTLEDEQLLNRLLLESGLPIGEMNLIRKHLSTIKGGRLARAAFPARVVTLVLSDIPGDIAAEVASGPTLPSGPTRHDALALVERARLALPDNLLRRLHDPSSDAPRPSDPEFAGNEVHVIGSASLSLEAAAAEAQRAYGLPSAILSDALEGEARDAGRFHAAIAREIAGRNRPLVPPILLLSGGETSVTVVGEAGLGGRNTEFALAAAIGLEGVRGNITGLAADTDGIDGASGGAGAFFDTTSATRLRLAGFDPKTVLARHQSGSAFAAIGDLLVSGPTRTNVNDFRAIIIRPD